MKYDVVIIGGGITGTGIAHELAKYQLKTILLESGTDVAFSATKQNGGVIHPGYDPHPGTLKAKLNPPGARMYPRLSKELGFKILQFNAVVKSNTAALKLYKKLGFIQLGIIPNGFLLPNGTYEDIIPHYISL